MRAKIANTQAKCLSRRVYIIWNIISLSSRIFCKALNGIEFVCPDEREERTVVLQVISSLIILIVFAHEKRAKIYGEYIKFRLKFWCRFFALLLFILQLRRSMRDLFVSGNIENVKYMQIIHLSCQILLH